MGSYVRLAILSRPMPLPPARCDFSILDDAGLNLQAVFDLAALPPALRPRLPEAVPEAAGCSSFRQLILVGHAGRRLWTQVMARGATSADPIDDFTVATVRRWMASVYPGGRYVIVYPGEHPVGLQALGQLAGWHHPSPFMVGINARFGSWFAYRAVVLADSRFPVTPPSGDVSPCQDCATRVCVASCPVGALAGARFDLAACAAHRLRADSSCAAGCLARERCPVGAEHRYEPAQIRHAYTRSLAALRHYGVPSAA